MSISSTRVKFLDKENKVLVKDFLKDLNSNKIFTSFTRLLLDDASLLLLSNAFASLQELQNTFSNVYRTLTDGTLANGLVDRVLSGLNLTDPKLAGVASLIALIKADTTGIKDDFLMAVLSKASDAVSNNPALLDNYKDISSDTTTQLILASLDLLVKDLAKSGFNGDILESVIAEDEGVSSGLTLEQLEAVLSRASPTRTAGTSGAGTTNPYTTPLANPSGGNPFLKPKAAATAPVMVSSDFGSALAFMKIYAIFKVVCYRAYVEHNALPVNKMVDQLLLPTPNVVDTVGQVVKYCITTTTDTEYGYRRMAYVLQAIADGIYKRMSVEGVSASQVSAAYDNYLAFFTRLRSTGLSKLGALKELDTLYLKNFYKSTEGGVSVITDPIYVYNKSAGVASDTVIDGLVTTCVSSYKEIMSRLERGQYAADNTVTVPKDLIPVYIQDRIMSKSAVTSSVGGMKWSVTDFSLPATVHYSQAIVTKNRVYLLGGYINGAPSSTVYTAPINTDGTLGTWTTGTSLPGTVHSSQAIVTKNRVYLLGGYINNAPSSTVTTAPLNPDGTLGTWTTGPSLPGTVAHSQSIVTQNRVYLLGGYINGAYSSTVYTAPINADGTLGTWTTGTSLPGTVYDSQVIVTKNRVYVLGGVINNANSSTVYTTPINADGTLGTWTTGTSLPDPVFRTQVIVTKNRVYLLGGVVSSSLSSTVYTAPITGGLNDYTPYYDGTNTPLSTNQFKLPDFTISEANDINYYIKY